MPGLDRTGPEGQGSRTGRKMGACAKNGSGESGPETYHGRSPGRARCIGMGRGAGRAAGRAARRGNGQGAGRGPGIDSGQK